MGGARLPDRPNDVRRLGDVADDVTVRRGDVSEATDVVRAVRETGATHVVHLAALLTNAAREHPRAALDANVVGTNNVFEAARTLDLVERYERRTGFEFDNARFYWVLAVYKLAGLGEMFFRRYLEGNSDDPMYPKMRHGVPALAERAQRIIDGEEPL